MASLYLRMDLVSNNTQVGCVVFKQCLPNTCQGNISTPLHQKQHELLTECKMDPCFQILTLSSEADMPGWMRIQRSSLHTLVVIWGIVTFLSFLKQSGLLWSLTSTMHFHWCLIRFFVNNQLNKSNKVASDRAQQIRSAQHQRQNK